jgi:hypothetical protein
VTSQTLGGGPNGSVRAQRLNRRTVLSGASKE